MCIVNNVTHQISVQSNQIWIYIFKILKYTKHKLINTFCQI